MARRRYQKGSLLPTQGLPKDGLWRGRWLEDVVQPNGDVNRVYKNEIIAKLSEFPTRKLALRALEDRIAHVNSRSYRPSLSMHFAGLAQEWTRDVLPTMKISVQRSEQSRVDVHLVPHFGTMQLRDIAPGDVQRFIAKNPCGPKTVKNCIATLRLLWNYARAQRYVTKADDWFDGIRLPEIQPADSPYFTEDEMRRIIQESEEPYRTFYWILAETGMRLGEACALRVKSIGDRMITVRQSAWQGHVGSTKSKRPRQFPISSALDGQIKTLCISEDPEAFLFAKGDGCWNGSDGVVLQHLKPLLTRLEIKQGVENVGAHAFRHGNCSIMDRLNIPAKVRQNRVGHANFDRMTLGTYTHAESQDERMAAEQLGAVFAPTVN